MYFYDINEMPYKQKKEKLSCKVITGEKIQIGVGKLKPGFVSDHSHPHEQMGRVFSGEIKLTIDGETKICRAGTAYHIPANVHHSFEVLSDEPAEIMDIFSPPKRENIGLGPEAEGYS